MLKLDRPPESVCILRLSAIGDVIHTVPILRTLQATWPNTRFTWIVGKLEATLIGDIPNVEFIIFDKSQGRKAHRQLQLDLAGREFDVLLMLQVALRASLASRYIKAKTRIGFDRARAKDFQWLFSDQKIDQALNEHVMDGLFGFCETLGIKHRVVDWHIPIPDKDLKYAQKIIANKPTVIISPCSSQRSRNFRNWSVDNYVQVCNKLIAEDFQILLTGGPSELEQEYGKLILASCNSKAIQNQIGQTTLKQLYALIKNANLVIAPDSGPVHMANSAQTPCIGLYAGSNPLRTGPYHYQHLVVNKYPQAARQYLYKEAEDLKWGQRVRHPEVMTQIQVEDVIEKLNAII
ncbi:MAG: glycosyltransferase family 9 protein [Gammaproteobacteria bacterium]|nr:glycosyltransferase family 9 protein [Gammaproteobacteria bacterium]